MTYLVLALKWRPQRFDDVVGQEHVSRTLSNALKTGRAAQAYLFTGPRGVGKTSMARILAKALNCGEAPADEPCNQCAACREITGGRSMDVIEIDGASNRGIDDIRELREAVRYAPASLKRKVYIIDEVHMLTQDAFNALLKTLEEPPAHVVFVLATTEPLKVPATILSRCQRFDFARLGPRAAMQRLRQICDAEGIAADDEGLFLIGRRADGSMRDALTLLDQVIAGSPERLSVDEVRAALGVAGREIFFEWTEAMMARDAARALRSLANALDSGANLLELSDEFLVHLRNLLLLATDPTVVEMVEATDEEIARYTAQAGSLAATDLLRCCRICLETGALMRRSGQPRAHFEVALAEMCLLPTSVELRKFIEAARGRVRREDASAPAVRPRVAAAPPPGSSAVPTPVVTRTEKKPREGEDRGARGEGESGAEAAVEPPPVHPAASHLVIEAVQEAAADPEHLPLSAEAEPWTRVLAELAAKKAGLAANLVGSFAAGEEDRILRVMAPGLGSYQRGALERPAHRKLIMELIASHFGRPLGVRFDEAPAGAGAVAGGVGGAPDPVPSRGEPAGAGRDAPAASPEGVRRITDLFGGEVIGPA